MNYYTDVIKKYATFTGRAGRKEFWMFVLCNFIVGIVIGIIDGILRTPILQIIYGLALIIPSLALAVRRLHDTSRSGWWILIGLIPFIGGIILIVFYVLDSTPGDNAYGPNPKGQAAAAMPTAPTVTPPQA